MFFAAAEEVPVEAGRKLSDMVLEWLAHDGVAFATRAAVALVMLLVGWLVIRLVSAAVCRAVTRGRTSNSLFATFIASVVTIFSFDGSSIFGFGGLSCAYNANVTHAIQSVKLHFITNLFFCFISFCI